MMRKETFAAKSVRIRRMAAFLFLAVLILLAAAAVYFIPLQSERVQMRQAVTGAYEAIAGMGQFVSEDGTTSSLAEDEISERINAFNRKIDCCYADEFPSKEYYKWLNEDYLTRTYKHKVDYIVKSGVADVRTPVIVYGSGRQEAAVHGGMIGWNLWITESDEGGSYKISYAYNKTPLDVSLVREQGMWKVSRISGVKGEPETIADEGIVSDAEEMSREGKLPREKEAILERLHRTDEVCQKEYASFGEALQAAEQIEFTDFNGYALV